MSYAKWRPFFFGPNVLRIGCNAYMPFYCEMTWEVGIAQLTHHAVQSGANVGLLLSHTLFGNHLYFFLKHDNSWKQQKNTLISERGNVHPT